MPDTNVCIAAMWVGFTLYMGCFVARMIFYDMFKETKRPYNTFLGFLAFLAISFIITIICCFIFGLFFSKAYLALQGI